MKRIIFLIIATLLVIGLVLPGCGGTPTPTRPKIIIGVPYPQGDIQGNAMLAGAQMAASEINVAGVTVWNGTANVTYDIQVVGRQDNEIYDPPNAWNAVNYLITNSHAQFIIGGFRTEAVIPMINNVFATASPSVPFFICGAATAELLSGIGLASNPPVGMYPAGSGTPYWDYNSTSHFYKYIFRTTPFDTGFLLGMVMSTFCQIAQQVQSAMNWTWNGTAFPHPVNVAVVGENLTWAAPIVGGYKALLLGYGALFGWNWTTTQTFSDTALPGVVDAALGIIETAQNQIILTCMSGPCGVTFGKEMAALGIHAIPVGINVEAQGPNYAVQTGSPNWEVTTGTYANGVANTNLTLAFISAYQAYTGSFPIYTAASYGQVYGLKEAIEATSLVVNGVDKDAVCTYLEANVRVDPAGRVQYYPEWDKVTHKDTLIRGFWPANLPALNSTQMDALYAISGYTNAYCNSTMAPFTSHDLVFGPGYLTGICTQWVNGTQRGMWPKAGYDAPMGPAALRPQNTLMRKLCALNWSNTLEYPGTQAAVIPAAYQSVWTGW